MTHSPSSPNPQSPILNASPTLWAFYLACSWTWCIGMFLPALLLRDAGWMGYAVFFIPNVIGAGAMGFVLRSPESAARIVRDHAAMTKAFSIVTVAFHVFWFAWVSSFIREAFPVPETWLMGAGAAGVAWAIVSGRAVRAGAAPRAATAIWLVGLLIFFALLARPDALGTTTAAMITGPDHPPTHPALAAWVMPVCVFGFMLCPYLDLTFLLARERSDGQRGGRVAFGLGFWVFFPVMIALTGLYAGPLIAVLEGRAAPTPPASTPWAGAAVVFHMIAQWIFTVRVHVDRLITPATGPDGSTGFASRAFGTLLAACLLAGLVGIAAPGLPSHAGLSAGEIAYRGFLSAYGLVFPVYVWSRMIPRRRQPTHAAWITACVLAMPFYWMGFIEREGVWLAPGILIAMVVPLLWRERIQPV